MTLLAGAGLTAFGLHQLFGAAPEPVAAETKMESPPRPKRRPAIEHLPQAPGFGRRRQARFFVPSAEVEDLSVDSNMADEVADGPLEAVSHWFPELEHDILQYREDVEQAELLVAAYEARVRAASEAIVAAGESSVESADAVREEREAILATARDLGQRAMDISRAIRIAAGVSDE